MITESWEQSYVLCALLEACVPGLGLGVVTIVPVVTGSSILVEATTDVGLMSTGSGQATPASSKWTQL